MITFRRVVLGPCSMPTVFSGHVQIMQQKEPAFLSVLSSIDAKSAYLAGKDVIFNLSACDVEANELNLLGLCVILGNGPANMSNSFHQVISARAPKGAIALMPSGCALLPCLHAGFISISMDAAGSTISASGGPAEEVRRKCGKLARIAACRDTASHL